LKMEMDKLNTKISIRQWHFKQDYYENI